LPLKQTVKHAALRALAAFDHQSKFPLRDVRTFLVLQHAAALGTVIHSTPLVPALRAVQPDAQIFVCTSGFGREVFEGNPGVDEVFSMPNPTKDFGGAVRKLREFIRGRGLTNFATLTPTGNERTAVGLAAWRAGAGNRVGFTLAPELYRAPLSFDSGRSQIANNLRIVSALGHEVMRTPEPQIFFGSDELVCARSLLNEDGKGSRMFAVFVTQTSPTQRKSWRAERFVAAAQFLVDRYGAEIVFVGTGAERGAIEELRGRVSGTTWNVAGQTSLRQLSALLSLCRVGLTLDTGTLHVGRAVGLPMVIIAPAWSPVVEWLPIGDPRFTILKNATLESAPADYVIDEVSVDEVIAALQERVEEGAS
jgi:ADP-heptose:LPS heptosyltransferase